MYKYLSAQDVKELSELEPVETDFFEEEGKKLVNRQSLNVAAAKLFIQGRKFKCFAHFKEYALVFASNWGFHLNATGFTLICARSGQEDSSKKSKTFKKAETPERQRKRINTTKVGCCFSIRSSPITLKDPTSGWKRSPTNDMCQVKITSVNFDHCANCAPGSDSQILARKHSGFYARSKICPEKLSHIVELLQTGSMLKEPKDLRHILQKYLPNHVTLSSMDLHNFRIRAKILYLKGTYKSITSEEANCMFDGLDDKERLDGELTRKVASELLREAWSDSGNVWVLESYLEKLRATGRFYYHIGRDDKNRPTGVFWATAEMLQDFVHFGDFVSLDAMKRRYNTLLWPYLAICVYDSEGRVRVCGESLCVEESFAAYIWIMNTIFELVPGRHRSSLKVIFGDCIMTPKLLDYIGIRETCRIFWDHFHLIDKVWEKHFGNNSAIFARIKPHLLGMLST